MRILIAPDKFKGSLSAREVAENIELGFRRVLPQATIDIVPMADGGEGTAEVISDALGGSWLKCHAHDPLGCKIEARYAYLASEKLAVTEMSEAAGLRRLTSGVGDPVRSVLVKYCSTPPDTVRARLSSALAEARPTMADSEWLARSDSDSSLIRSS